MKVFEMVERIGYFHSLVMKEVTGSPCKFAERLNISRTNLYNLIEEMRGYGIEIEYSRTKGTFYYKEPYRVKINISIESLSDDELKNIDGGCTFLLPSIILDGRTLSLY